ncbi:MAG TPA: ABC transporter substrate-binding protein, partial [Acetobacteraceae bacterium]
AIGTGPYRLASWSPGNPLILKRNETYWGKAPPWEEVRILPMPRDAARISALSSGEVDFINRVPISDVAQLRADPKLKLFSGLSAYVFMLYPDVEAEAPQGVRDNAGQPLEHNPFKDGRVREAMSLAIDRAALVAQVMQGFAVPVSQAVPAGFFGYSPNIKPVAANPERARSLLAEAGYGQGFQAELSCPNDRFANDAQICEAVAQQLARVGINATVAAMPSAVFFPRRGRHEFGLHMAGWGSLTGESSYFLGAHVHSTNRAMGLGSINTNGISDPEIDRLIEQARPVLDDARRRTLLEQAMELTIARNWVIPALAFDVISAGRADRVSYRTRADEETLAAEIMPAK